MTDKHFNVLRWSPIGASIALVALIAIISKGTISELRQATNWRQQAFKAILEAQTFEDKLLDAQSNVHGYAEKGQPSLLIEYRNDTNVDMTEMKRLAQLVQNDAEQQQRLKELSNAVHAVFAYDNKVIGVYALQGMQSAVEADEADEGKADLDLVVKDLQAFTTEEKAQLGARDAAEQKEYHRAARLLLACSVTAAVLLILANVVAGREMARRRQAEMQQRKLIDELQQALAEVKTLSGLIPICGWCKSVRSDSGYWESVEHYVRARTDATFSHGMCPSCCEKFKADIAARAGGVPSQIPPNSASN